ncbi:MAG: PaaI family thioesterase [Nitrospirae bacterium]|nr:PaaI family thioesterase [Nitrospirota bacterium]
MSRLLDNGYCFACGSKNTEGLKLSFTSHGSSVTSVFVLEKRHQGYKDVVHGGIICTILDEAMVKAGIEAGASPVTVELTVRFKESLGIGEKAVVEAEVDRADSGGRKLISAKASLRRLSDNKLLAVASSKLLNMT